MVFRYKYKKTRHPIGYPVSGVSDEARTRFPVSREPPGGDSQEPCRTSDFNAPSAQVEAASSSPIPANGKKTGHPIGCPKWSE